MAAGVADYTDFDSDFDFQPQSVSSGSATKPVSCVSRIGS